jgi:splicing factor 4
LNTASASGKKGHHMGDYIPQEELEKFLASCNDAAAMKAAKEAAEKAKIQADNVGHRLLSKMGWKEGAYYFLKSFNFQVDESILCLHV